MCVQLQKSFPGSEIEFLEYIQVLRLHKSLSLDDDVLGIDLGRREELCRKYVFKYLFWGHQITV